MMPKNQEVPVRLIKKKSGHAGHHGGAWKVAYADFVTAMMALFIVLWIVGQNKAVKESVAGYFKDPVAFMENAKGGGTRMLAGTPGDQASTSLVQEAEVMKQLGEQIMQELSTHPDLAGIASQVRFELVSEGLRIELLEKSESFFFDVGTSEMRPDAAAILTLIAREVGRIPNRLAVEGHTDSRPYARQDGYTNFELSSERANCARRILVRGGVLQSQIDEVRGYADTRLRNRDNPLDLTNRRISVLIKFTHT